MSLRNFDICFEKEDFHEPSFNPDHFLQKYQPIVSLDVLSEDLDLFSKELTSSLVGVINEDYQDFIGLASNLVGLEVLCKKLREPLTGYLENLKVVKSELRETVDEIVDCKQKQCKAERDSKLAKCNKEITRICNTSMDLQPVERLVAELAYLKILSVGFNDSEIDKRGINKLEEVVLKKLSVSFVAALEKQQRDVCNTYLNFYALLDLHTSAEDTIRRKFVRPKLEALFDTNTFGSEPSELDRFFVVLKNTIVTQFSLLLDLSVQHLSASDSAPSFCILVNSLWPELAEKTAEFESLFSTGDMEHFQQKYLLVMSFLSWYEELCDSYGSSRTLKTREDYLSLKTKWNFSVYYQARFQEIAGSLEMALHSPFNSPIPSSDDLKFKLASTACLWSSLLNCWSESVFVGPLTNRFWKLTLQLLSRYNTWLRHVLGKESSLSLEQLAMVYSDIIDLDRNQYLVKIKALERIGERIENVPPSFEAAFDEGHSSVTSQLAQIISLVIGHLTNQSATFLESISDIPRLFRRTNKMAPSSHCPYVGSVFEPLVAFKDKYKEDLGIKDVEIILGQVTSSLVSSYSLKVRDLLESVAKTEESLRRLRKAREKTPTNPSAGLSDDDKIRQQVSLDVEFFVISGKSLSSEVDFSGLTSAVEKAKV